MAYLYVVADGEADGLFWIESGSKPEVDLAGRLAKKPGSRFYLAGRWEIVGGPAGAHFLRDAANGCVPPHAAKRYKDGAWTGNLKIALAAIEELYNLFKDGPADRLKGDQLIKGLRAHLDVQMVVLAQIMGVSTSMISRQEAGLADVSWQHIARFVDFCHTIGKPVPLALIFGHRSKPGAGSKGKQHGEKTKVSEGV